jgi:hypothetical protein
VTTRTIRRWGSMVTSADSDARIGIEPCGFTFVKVEQQPQRTQFARDPDRSRESSVWPLALAPVRKTPEHHKRCEQEKDDGRDRRLVAA